MEYPYYPIIYVRGFAFSQEERMETVDDPYMGFNIGSVRIRQKSDKSVKRRIFESALLRLMKDFNYTDSFYNGEELQARSDSDGRQIYIFRYYEKEWSMATKNEDVTQDSIIVNIAKDLAYFIWDVEKHYRKINLIAHSDDFKINLVAHSMGGLICRCMLQNRHCRNIHGAHQKVHKVFTYGTPHNGIDATLIGNAPGISRSQIRNFNRDYMREYLEISGKSDVNSLDGKFSTDNFFSLIGTNSKDYRFGAGWVGWVTSVLTGSAGDGLVRMENAYVKGGPQAHVFLSHSGPFGLVNSEEGYQHLTRFLFGNIKITGKLDTSPTGKFGIPKPPNLPPQSASANGISNPADIPECGYYFSTSVSVKGDKHYSERRVLGEDSAILRTTGELESGPTRKPFLFSLFLNSNNATHLDNGGRQHVIAIDLEVSTTDYQSRLNEEQLDPTIHGDNLYRDKIYILLDLFGKESIEKLESVGYFLDSDGFWQNQPGTALNKNDEGNYLIPLNNKKGFSASLSITIQLHKEKPTDLAETPIVGEGPGGAKEPGELLIEVREPVVTSANSVSTEPTVSRVMEFELQK